MRNRKLNQAYAKLNGYFWAPCPHCGKMYGGHEWKGVNGKESSIPDPEHPTDGRYGMGICPDCTKAGIAEVYWKDLEKKYGPRWL